MHRLPPGAFGALAAGQGTPAVVKALLAARRSRHLFLLRGVLDHLAGVPQPQARAFEANYAALAAVQRVAPSAVRTVLAYPLVGAWLAHCLRRLRGDDGTATPVDADLAHLGSVAAAAAVRGGTATAVVVPVREGTVALPTLGRLHLGDRTGDGLAAMSYQDGRVTFPGRGRAPVRLVPRQADTPGWEALRRAVVTERGLTLCVDVDDVDPYRDCARLGAAPRLGAGEWRVWQDRLRSAWRVLAVDHPDQAAALAAGVVALVPLTRPASGESRSATQTDAAATVALSLPADPSTFAVTLVHELQHTTLNLLHDLVPLLVPTGGRHYSPWRPDPRPLWGLLHGTYAFLGVARFWRAEAAARPTPAARLELARSVHDVGVGQRALRESGRLTPAGERLVRVIGDTVRRWAPEIDDDLRRLAADLNADHHATWRLRNLAVDPQAAAALAAAWLAGQPDPPGPLPAARVVAGPAPRPASPRLQLARRLDAGLSTGDGALDGVSASNLHLLRGAYQRAAAGYLAHIANGAAVPDAWAGLAVACGRLAGSPGHELLHRRPELVHAVHRSAAAGGPGVDVLALASWLSRGAG
ncbi:MAG TPA: HEXXH motif domain-containing protein [Micromonosporaceae bacterium]|nr:HEXXH motif domain-containing protein [Micromonosporaceae bacterium]